MLPLLERLAYQLFPVGALFVAACVVVRGTRLQARRGVMGGIRGCFEGIWPVMVDRAIEDCILGILVGCLFVLVS